MAFEKVKRSENYSEWYNNLVKNADMAEHADVKGCMVIKPYGYAIWEKMQAQLDKMFKKTGHVNAYFPLLIPKSFFECIWCDVTHRSARRVSLAACIY